MAHIALHSDVPNCRVVRHAQSRSAKSTNSSIHNLPLLIYRAAITADRETKLGDVMERTFSDNGYPAPHRFGKFDQAHFHSITHEILGVSAGSARFRHVHCSCVLPPSCLSKQHCHTQDSMIICTNPLYTSHRMCQLQSVLLDVVICLQRVSAQAQATDFAHNISRLPTTTDVCNDRMNNTCMKHTESQHDMEECRFGGPEDAVIEDVHAGDVMLLPAGLVHSW